MGQYGSVRVCGGASRPGEDSSSFYARSSLLTTNDSGLPLPEERWLGQSSISLQSVRGSPVVLYLKIEHGCVRELPRTLPCCRRARRVTAGTVVYTVDPARPCNGDRCITSTCFTDSRSPVFIETQIHNHFSRSLLHSRPVTIHSGCSARRIIGTGISFIYLLAIAIRIPLPSGFDLDHVTTPLPERKKKSQPSSPHIRNPGRV
jgi:hypothetical protein